MNLIWGTSTLISSRLRFSHHFSWAFSQSLPCSESWASSSCMRSTNTDYFTDFTSPVTTPLLSMCWSIICLTSPPWSLDWECLFGPIGRATTIYQIPSSWIGLYLPLEAFSCFFPSEYCTNASMNPFSRIWAIRRTDPFYLQSTTEWTLQRGHRLLRNTGVTWDNWRRRCSCQGRPCCWIRASWGTTTSQWSGQESEDSMSSEWPSETWGNRWTSMTMSTISLPQWAKNLSITVTLSLMISLSGMNRKIKVNHKFELSGQRTLSKNKDSMHEWQFNKASLVFNLMNDDVLMCLFFIWSGCV